MAENRSIRQGDSTRGGGLGAVLFAGGALGAAVLVVSQFLTLFHTHIQAKHLPIASATVGSEHAYALLPIAAVALFLAYGVWSVASRPALLGLGAFGVAARLIALLHDLPYAQKSGLRIRGGHYVLAVNQPAIGIYAETLGATILIVTCVSGFILLGPPARRRRSVPDGRRTASTV